jgi:hypothetical protein
MDRYSTDNPQQQSEQTLLTIESKMRPTSTLTSPEWHNLQSRRSDAEQPGQRHLVSAPLEKSLAHSRRVKDRTLRHAMRRGGCSDNTRGHPLSEEQTTPLASLPRHSKRRNTDDETSTQAVAMQKTEEVAEGVESSSSSGDATATRDKGAISSRDSSGGNGSASSRNVVTATTTTSSGDDRDSSGGNGSTNSATATIEHIGSGSEMLRHSHHYHRVRRRSHTANEGSALRVPGDDGSDRLAGGVSATSATVMASRLYPDATTFSFGSGGEGGAQQSGSLLQPHREHTIPRTFISLPRRKSRRVRQFDGSINSSSNGGIKEFKTKHGLSNPKSSDATRSKKSKAALRARGRGSPSPDSVHSKADGGGSSSGSGTEGGYAGSASSNEMAGHENTCSSPSVCSSEESRPSKSKRHRNLEHIERKTSKKSGRYGNSVSSSEIADFSSSLSDSGVVDGGFTIKTMTASPSASPSLSSCSNGGVSGGDLEASFLRAKREAMINDTLIQAVTRKRRVLAEAPAWARNRMPATLSRSATVGNRTISGALLNANSKPSATLNGKAAILALGSDTMAHVLTYLEPPDILDVLTMPLSKDWRQSFTFQPELWRVLCLVEPFNAKIKDEGLSSGEESFCSLNQDRSKIDKKFLGCYRLLYTSFVRCMKYLSQIKDDAINGRPPSFIDYGLGFDNHPDEGTIDTHAPSVIGPSKSLQSFLSRARGVIVDSKSHGGSSESCENTSESSVQLSGNDPANDTNDSSYGSSSTGRKVNPAMLIMCFSFNRSNCAV